MRYPAVVNRPAARRIAAGSVVTQTRPILRIVSPWRPDPKKITLWTGSWLNVCQRDVVTRRLRAGQWVR